MFKTAEKKKALQELDEAKLKFNKELLILEKIGDDNYNAKLGAAHSLIPKAENLLDNLVNCPPKYRRVLHEYKIQKTRMISFANKVRKEVSYTEKKSKKGKKKISINTEDIFGSTGVAGGVGIATLGPTAATAIASTYGVASTGVAVSTLSGAAAQSAALAWLGGGSLAAGGGGIAAGKALLALAGPVGWAAGGVAIVGTGVYKYLKRVKTITDTKEEARKLNLLRSNLPSAIKKLQRDTDLVNKTHEVAGHHVNYLMMHTKSNFKNFSEIEKKELDQFMTSLSLLTANMEGKDFS